MIILALLFVALLVGIIFLMYERARQKKPQETFQTGLNIDTLGIPKEHLLDPSIIPNRPQKMEYYSWQEKNVVPGTMPVYQNHVDTGPDLYGANTAQLV